MERRKSEFKKGVNQDDSRRRREAATVAVRKEKKEENLLKRRNMASSSAVEAAATPAATAAGASAPPSPMPESIGPANFPAMRDGLLSSEPHIQQASIKAFRKALSVEQNPPIQECIDCGAISLFVQYLQRQDSTALQFEAAWALTNIASTSQTQLVAEHGAIPYLVALLASENADLREQCAWCLGNVAGDSASLRDIVLGHGALPALLANIQQPATISLLRNCVWTLSNFCRGKPQPKLSQVAPALPVLAALITQQSDFETISDAVWALSYISDGNNERIQAVVEAGGGVVVPALVNMLRSNKILVVVPALRTLGNIASGNDAQTQLVVNHDVISALHPLLSHVKKNIRKEVCWMLSNIAAGNRSQLNKLMATPGLVSDVVGQLDAKNDWEVRKEAAWVVSNIVTSSDGLDNWAYIKEIVSFGVLGPLCDLLEVGDARIVIVAMESLEAVLRAAMEADGANPGNIGGFLEQYCRVVEEHEGIDRLEGLQEHENEDIYNKAVSIIETYFGGCEEDEQEVQQEGGFLHGFGNTYNFNGPAPTAGNPTTNGKQYDFGMPAATGNASTDFASCSPAGFGTMQAAPAAFGSAGNGNSMLPPPPNAFAFGNL